MLQNTKISKHIPIGKKFFQHCTGGKGGTKALEKLVEPKIMLRIETLYKARENDRLSQIFLSRIVWKSWKFKF